jgi:hypothetical protein
MAATPEMTKSSDEGRVKFDVLVEELTAELDVQRASMFGMPSVKRRGGKAFAGLYGDDMVFKLDGAAHAEALGLEGAHLFEPMAGRPMKAWVQVPLAHEQRWLELARVAEQALG